MNLRRVIFGSDENRQQQPRHSKVELTIVRRTADTALRQYEKTFNDLARYDRGEPVVLPR